MIYPCGCENVIDPKWNIGRSVSKCEFHQRHAGRGGLAYYLEMGCIQDGLHQGQRYGQELTEPLQSVGVSIPPGNDRPVLEIGCGLGMYAPLFMGLGYQYEGLEPDTEAAEWTASTFGVPVYPQRFEDFKPSHKYGAIIAAHVFEHLQDAPQAMQRCFEMLAPTGMIYVVVPDDMDPVNPDHLCFFTPETLKTTLESVGFVNVRMAVRKIVAHENFIYAVGEKPGV